MDSYLQDIKKKADLTVRQQIISFIKEGGAYIFGIITTVIGAIISAEMVPPGLLLMFFMVVVLLITALLILLIDKVAKKKARMYEDYLANVIGKYVPVIDKTVKELSLCQDSVKRLKETVVNQSKVVEDQRLVIAEQSKLINNLIIKMDKMINSERIGKRLLQNIRESCKEIKGAMDENGRK